MFVHQRKNGIYVNEKCTVGYNFFDEKILKLKIILKTNVRQ